MTTGQKRGRGRPPKELENLLEPMTIRLTKEIVQRVEKIRASRMDGADKSTIVRELIVKGLGA